MKFKHDTYYPNIKEQIELLKKDELQCARFYADDYLHIFKNFNWLKNEDRSHRVDHIAKIPFGFTRILSVKDNTHFTGYFQSDKYWDKNRKFVIDLFEPSDFIVNKLEKYSYLLTGNTCAIHVRRGDYLKFQFIHPPVTLDYINNARMILESRGVEKYFVFSDDIKWCRENLIGDEYFFIEDEKDYIELFLMGKCVHKIISNSTFSWWGSYLSPTQGITIAPKTWVIKSRTDASYICPQSWIRI